jgi:rhodanese-related sulfurtransferase
VRSSPSSPARDGWGGFHLKNVLFEGLLVAVAGAALAFAANALSPRGLHLTTDFLRVGELSAATAVPGAGASLPATGNSNGAAKDATGPGSSPTAVPVVATNAAQLAATNAISPAISSLPSQVAGATTNSAWALLAARLGARGLQLADSNQVAQLFHDPRCGQGLVVFIDARNEEHYQEGHIPGAYLLDYFHPEKHLASVWQACQTAQQIVVYCNGGDCQDSELAAMMLSDNNVPKEKLFIYGGGIAEWATNGLPIEVGEQKSGRLLKTTK